MNSTQGTKIDFVSAEQRFWYFTGRHYEGIVMVNKFYVIVIAKLFYDQVERFHVVALSREKLLEFNGAFGFQIEYKVIYT